MSSVKMSECPHQECRKRTSRVNVLIALCAVCFIALVYLDNSKFPGGIAVFGLVVFLSLRYHDAGNRIHKEHTS